MLESGILNRKPHALSRLAMSGKRPELELPMFSRMRSENNGKIARKCAPITEVTASFKEIGYAGSIGDVGETNGSRFTRVLRMRSENNGKIARK